MQHVINAYFSVFLMDLLMLDLAVLCDLLLESFLLLISDMPHYHAIEKRDVIIINYDVIIINYDVIMINYDVNVLYSFDGYQKNRTDPNISGNKNMR